MLRLNLDLERNPRYFLWEIRVLLIQFHFTLYEPLLRRNCRVSQEVYLND